MGPSIYFFILIFYIILILLTNKVNKMHFLPFILLILFSGLRYGVGTDFFNYMDIHTQLINNSYPWGIEAGYKYLVLFIHKIGGEQQLIFFTMSFFTVFFTYKFLRKESPDFVLSSLLYILIGPYYLSSMNGIRQALAIAIFSYSIVYLKEKEYGKYTILILIAGLFHTSALVLYPVALLMQRRYKIIVIIMAIITLVAISQSNFIVSFLDFLSYDNLITYDAYSFDPTLIIFLVVGLGMVFLIEKYGIPENMTIYYNMGIGSLSLIILALLTNRVSSIVFMRFNNYFFNAYLVLVPLILQKFKEKKLLKIIVITSGIAYFAMVVFTGSKMLPFNFNVTLF